MRSRGSLHLVTFIIGEPKNIVQSWQTKLRHMCKQIYKTMVTLKVGDERQGKEYEAH